MSNLQLISVLLYVLVLLGFAGLLWMVTNESKHEHVWTVIVVLILLAAFAITLTASPHVWRNL